MSPITEEALSKDHWPTAEGWIIVWKQNYSPLRGDEFSGYYVWGRNPANEAVDPFGSPGGWCTAQWAVVYPSYAEAAEATRTHQELAKVQEKNIRIVKIRRRPPLEILFDCPVGILDAPARV